VEVKLRASSNLARDIHAPMTEQADDTHLKRVALGRAGSNPAGGILETR
jgi:hypothetical protein